MDNVVAPELERFEIGDWIVHRQHGAGQIQSIEKKQVGDIENTYCKITSHKITIWLPIEKVNDEWLRPLASPAEIEQSLAVLKELPQPMSNNLNTRKSQIKKVNSNDSPEVIAELLRDLWARKKEKKTLPQAEEAALHHFTDCFLAEWAASLEITMNGAREEFKELIQRGQDQAAKNRSELIN